MTAMRPRPKCHSTERLHVGITDGDSTAGRPVKAGHAGTECTCCGKQVDSHAGHTDDGRVSACGKGKPPMRGAGYHRRHCDPTAISPEKCEPEGVGHD